MSIERRKENTPMPTTLPLYTIRLPLWNRSSGSNIPSESYPTISLTTNITPYHHIHATLSNFSTHHIFLLSYRIIPPPSDRILGVSQRLCICLTQVLPHHLRPPIIIPNYLPTSLTHDSILPPRFEVLQEDPPMVLASVDIIDEIRLPPAGHPQIL